MRFFFFFKLKWIKKLGGVSFSLYLIYQNISYTLINFLYQYLNSDLLIVIIVLITTITLGMILDFFSNHLINFFYKKKRIQVKIINKK